MYSSRCYGLDSTKKEDLQQGEVFEKLTTSFLKDYFGQDATVTWVDWNEDEVSRQMQVAGIDVVISFPDGSEIYVQVKWRSSRYHDFGIEGHKVGDKFVPAWRDSHYMVFFFEDNGDIILKSTAQLRALWDIYGDSLGKVYPVNEARNQWLLVISREVASWGPNYQGDYDDR